VGHIRHNAIVVTTSTPGKQQQLVETLCRLEIPHLPQLKPGINGHYSTLVYSSGSKCGWLDAEQEKTKFLELKDFLHGSSYGDGSSPYEWFHAWYGSDDRKATIVETAWGVENISEEGVLLPYSEAMLFLRLNPGAVVTVGKETACEKEVTFGIATIIRNANRVKIKMLLERNSLNGSFGDDWNTHIPYEVVDSAGKNTTGDFDEVWEITKVSGEVVDTTGKRD